MSTFRQYTIIRAEFTQFGTPFNMPLLQVPLNITLYEASTIPVSVATAALGLYGTKQQPFGGIGLTPPWQENGQNKYAGELILIIAGSSSVGQHGTALIFSIERRP